MTRNVSTAVMQRRVEPHDSLDDFPTPPCATRALCQWIGPRTITASVREPTANRGYMAGVLDEFFYDVEASDIFDYGAGFVVRDYLFGPIDDTHWTIFNPPVRLPAMAPLVSVAVGIALAGSGLFDVRPFMQPLADALPLAEYEDLRPISDALAAVRADVQAEDQLGLDLSLHALRHELRRLSQIRRGGQE